MTKGAIYYTDNRARHFILKKCQKEIKRGWKGKLVSVSLKPVDFGENITLAGRKRSYPTMVAQIVTALEAIDTDVVFFLEHDVLYHPSHFDFWPAKKEIYYYNLSNWRWGIKDDFAVTYDGLHSLSQLCCFRETALTHFRKRLAFIEKEGWNKERAREPRMGRAIGYEPGTKPTSRGGFSDEEFEVWRSELPNIDIRHRHTFSSPAYHPENFKKLPKGWRQEKLENIPYWNLRTLKDNWFAKYEREINEW